VTEAGAFASAVSVKALWTAWDSHWDATLYTASSLAKSLAQFLVGFFVVRLILPEELGVWNSISLASTYAIFLQGGIINGLNRELPYQLGTGRAQRAEAYAGTAQSYTAAGCFLGLILGGISLIVFRGKGFSTSLAIVAVTLMTGFTFYQNYLMVTFRSKSSFNDLARIQFLAALLMVLTIPMLYLWRYNGMLLRIILVTAGGVWLLHRVRPIRVNLIWDWDAFKNLMLTGLPIFILAYIESTAGTVDRLVLLKSGGVEQVGYYSLALYMMQSISIIPLSLTSYVYPRMSYSFGKTGDPMVLWNKAWKATLAVFGIMAPLTVAGWFAIPVAVPMLFPKYVPGIFPAQITLVGAFFYGAVITVIPLWSMKAWKYMIAYQLSGSALRVAGPYIGAKLFSSPLTGVAYGMFCVYVVNFGVGLGLTYVATHHSQRTLNFAR